MNSRVGLVVAVMLCACKGPPAEISISSAEVKDGQHGKFMLAVADADHHPLMPDGKLSVVFVDDSGAERCRGEGVADPAQAFGDQHTVQVAIVLDHVCKPSAPGKTKATYVFTPKTGAPVTRNETFMIGLDDWDATQQTVKKIDAAADPLVPKLEAEVKRIAGVLDLVPKVGTEKDKQACDPALRAAFEADPPATLLYQELQRIAGEHPSEDFSAYSWASEGCYAAMSQYRENLRAIATSTCQDTWKQAKYLEVYRVSGFEKPVKVPNKLEFHGGNLWGELFLIDIDAHKLLCRVVLDSATGSKVWVLKGHVEEDFERQALSKLGDSWKQRRALAEKQIAGAELKHAP